MSPKVYAFTRKCKGIARDIQTDVIVGKRDSDKGYSFRAIWDTGATGTCITKEVAEKLGLKPVAYTQSYTAGGISEAPQYIVNIGLPNKIAFRDLRVTEFVGSDHVQVLVGMDIICAGDFSVTNANGETWVSFRIPEDYRHIDYEKAQEKSSSGKNAKEYIEKNQRN